MSDLQWKPGPPPLDVPGNYLIALPPNMGGHPVWQAEVIEHAEPWVHGPLSKDGRWNTFFAAIWHLGPIPSPPTGETNAE